MKTYIIPLEKTGFINKKDRNILMKNCKIIPNYKIVQNLIFNL